MWAFPQQNNFQINNFFLDINIVVTVTVVYNYCCLILCQHFESCT